MEIVAVYADAPEKWPARDGDRVDARGGTKRLGSLIPDDGELAFAGDGFQQEQTVGGETEGAVLQALEGCDEERPDQILAPRRYDDQGKDLWTTFNVAQENVLRGGLSGIQRNPEGRRVRRVSTREIKGIDGNVQLNRALWTLAERLAELKGTDVPFAEAEVVQAAA
jgi:Domain of unknown function (DUF932)